MAARARFMFRTFRTVFNRASSWSAFGRNGSRGTKLRSTYIKTGGLLCTQAVLTSIQTDTTADCDNQKLKTIDPKTLTSSYLIRNAATVNVDSAMTILSQTTTTLLEIHEKYDETVKQLLALQEMVVEAYGKPQQEERVADAIVVVRKKLNDIRAAKQEMEVLLGSVERLVNNAAEVAFFSGAEHACTLANEQLYSAREKLNAAMEKTQKAELAISEREAWAISETMKRDEELKRKTTGAEQREETPETQTDDRDHQKSQVENTDNTEVSVDLKSTFPNIDISNSQFDSAKSVDTEDWFSVILDENSSNTSSAQEFSSSEEHAFEEQEDERKWANAK